MGEREVRGTVDGESLDPKKPAHQCRENPKTQRKEAMHRVAVINVVGLTAELVGNWTPNLRQFVSRGWSVPMTEQFPAVTCSSQAAMLTGATPRDHGIVGNGWYFHDLAEVGFWKQNNRLIQAEPIYRTLARRDPSFTCAKVFWWYNMYSGADYSITPRPHYLADGGKVFDVYSHPMSLAAEMKEDLGAFPFLKFWGPASGIESSQWIARSAQWIYERHQPTLSLVYLPHLDYPLQKFGPDAPELENELLAIDDVVGELIHFYEGKGVRVLIVSEYGITSVGCALHPNRILREADWIRVRPTLGTELLDCGASEAFAVADHQIAHVYVRDPENIPHVAHLFESIDGIGTVLHGDAIREANLDHERAGDVILQAPHDAWYTYYYWQDDAKAPDFARTVDIHRKPGYDPVELFLDPELTLPRLRILGKLLRKKLGFRTLMNLIPLRPDLVRGSHGTPVARPEIGPLAASTFEPVRPDTPSIPITQVRDLIEAMTDHP